MLRIGVVMYQTSKSKGQELVAQNMVREFKSLGFDSYLITSIFHDWEKIVDEEEVRSAGGYIIFNDDVLGIPVIRVDSYVASWPPRRIFFKDFQSVLSKIVERLKINVIITHSTLWNGPEEVSKFVAWRRKLIQEGKMETNIIFAHMSHYQEPSEERYGLEERAYRKAWNETVLPNILNIADVILVTTPVEEEKMLKIGARKEKVMLFPAGISEVELKAGVNLRKKFGIPEGAKLITYLGTLEERKNPAALLKVASFFQDNKEVHFVIAGRKEGEYAANVENEARKLKNVTLTGELSQEEKYELIKESYVNIIMSRSEALGITQLEFMYAGKPVITSGVGGQSWIVRDGKNGIVLSGPDDIEGACNAIRVLLREKQKYRQMSKNASEFSRQFTLTKLVHSLLKRLSRIAESSPAIEKYDYERTIEALSGFGRTVVVTTRRLIVLDSRGKEITSTPLSSIRKIRKSFRASLAHLFAGATMTVLLILLFHIFTPWFLASIVLEARGLLDVLSLVPLLVSSSFFVLSLQEGYFVEYEDGSIFLPGFFRKTLELVDSLTPTELFSEG